MKVFRDRDSVLHIRSVSSVCFFVFGLLYVNVRGISFIICVHAPSPPISRGFSLMITERNHSRKRVVTPIHFLQKDCQQFVNFCQGFSGCIYLPCKTHAPPGAQNSDQSPTATGFAWFKDSDHVVSNTPNVPCHLHSRPFPIVLAHLSEFFLAKLAF